MKTLSRRYALLALVTLALGVGLIAAAPAQALVQYNDITDVTLNPIAVTFDTSGNPILPAPGYDLKIGGVSEFRIDLLSLTGYTYTDPSSQVSATINNARAGGVTGVASGANVLGHDQAESLTLYIFGTPVQTVNLTVPETNKLIKDAPINSSTFTTATPISGFPLSGSAMRGDVTALVFATGSFKYGGWVNPSSPNTLINGYVGFEFPDSIDPAKLHYGWVYMGIGPNGTGSNNDIQKLYIYSYAYENVAGAPILAGQTTGGAVVPLPASVFLLGSGLMGLGLLGWRRKA